MKSTLSIITLILTLSSYLHANECQDLAAKLISDEFQGIQSTMNRFGQCCTTIAALPFFYECVEIESMRAGVSEGQKMDLSDAFEHADTKFLHCKQMARNKLALEGIEEQVPSYYFVDGDACVVKSGRAFDSETFSEVKCDSGCQYAEKSFRLPMDPEAIKQLEKLLADLKKDK